MSTQADQIYSITTQAERDYLASLAREVPVAGRILEVGGLYGGTTAVLAKANSHARVVTIDDFSWHPENMPETSKALLLENMESLDIHNVTVIQGDSRIICHDWKEHIDLLFIDGGHSYVYVFSDLFNFGKRADVIALHDYKNPVWDTIEKVINTYLRAYPNWYLDKVVDMVAVLRRMTIK